MQGFTDFLVNHYLWFLIISIILVFALIGYFVDQNEQKKGVSTINKPKEKEVDLQQLASIAQNKSINSAISEAAQKSVPNIPNMPMNGQANTITDMTTNSTINQNNNLETLTK